MSDRESHAWIAFWMSDWNGGTFALTPMAEWAYFRLSIDVWESGAPITDDRAKRLLQRAGDSWKELIAELIDEGKIKRDRQGRLRIRRAEIEHNRAADRYSSKSGAAKKMHEIDRKPAPKLTPKTGEESNASDDVHTAEHDATRAGTGTGEDTNVSSPPTPQGGEQVDFLSPIPDEAWEKFEAHRREMDKPLTPEARKRARKVLTNLAAKGEDPTRVIEQTIDRAWLTFFPVKADASEKKSGWRFPGE
jgi:uncharacterized protein YdaU (DUF1376 family)